jgi:hypothetical protein
MFQIVPGKKDEHLKIHNTKSKSKKFSTVNPYMTIKWYKNSGQEKKWGGGGRVTPKAKHKTSNSLDHWYSTWGTPTPGGMRRHVRSI